MQYDAIIVGSGIAGLTAAAYLSKAGKSVLICEKNETPGGLVNNFERDGFVYEGGIRALEDSGVLFPMLQQLGIDIDFLPNRVSIGLEDRIIRVTSDDSVDDYRDLLLHFYPEQRSEIEAIIEQVKLIMKYMDVQYGIKNPMFLDFKKDREYMLKKVVPWMFKYAVTAPKIWKMNLPVVDFLRQYTHDQSLIDIISQHFFTETPAFFALSYLKLYLDYHYPRGGTGQIVKKLVSFIEAHSGKITTGTQIVSVDPEKHLVRDSDGSIYQFGRLIWAADAQALYKAIDLDTVTEASTRQAVAEHREFLSDKSGNDSVFTIWAGVKLNTQYFSEKCTEHFFYTPSRTGQSVAGPLPLGSNRKTTELWLEEFLKYTTYEISIPALRDTHMAPTGKTGLIISFLFDYKLTKQIEEQGWYEGFKSICEKRVIEILDASVYPGIKKTIQHLFSSSPLTMARLNGSHEGAITGWSFTNRPIPAESRLPKILNAIKTPLPGLYQAGQWTYSPSGLPIAFLTGKIAADQVIKDLK
jgi:phytoene dehydrogenase-like protein